MEEGFDRDGAMAAIKGNMNSEEMKVYLDREHEGHDEAVSAVTDLLENHFNDQEPQRDFFNQAETELRQSMYSDPRSVREQLEDIFNPKSEAGRAYLDSGHPKHAEMVQRASILMEARHDDKPRKDADARWPIRTRTAANSKQSGSENTY